MIDVFTARSGVPSLRIDGRAIHSPYDPVREAERFAAQGVVDPSPSTVVVVGEGLGYVSAAVRRQHPGSRVLPLVLSEQVHHARGRADPEAWHPGTGIPVDSWLRARLGELDVEGLRLLEWPPSGAAFPAEAREAAEAVRQVVQELNGSFATTCAAGKLWLRNSLANYLFCDEVLDDLPRPARGPLVVAAPGPSLEECIPAIRARRASFALWALPSCCQALEAAEIAPDLVVLTDPGWWAMHHLHGVAARTPVAMPLSAARGTWQHPRGPAPVCFLSQPVFYERALLAAAALPAREVTPHGTVAASAVELALAVARGPVVVAGLDMCTRDLLSHARPNAFDTLLHLGAGRTSPHEGQWHARSEAQGARPLPHAPGYRASASLRTYAGWFDGMRDAGVARLRPSPVPLAHMRPLSLDDFDGLCRDAAGPAVHRTALRPGAAFRPAPAERRRRACALLEAWASTASAAAADPSWLTRQDDPGREPTALSIVYMVEPRLLVDARRHARMGRARAAAEGAARAASAAADFLRGCARRVGDAA